jgi:branched-chain amino acid:cation transporter, LIVCS family
LLGAIAIKIIGANAGIVVCITIALACLTTAIALCSVFADFLQNQVFQGKVNYQVSLVMTLCLTFFVATYEFTGISSFLTPVLELIYPSLIVLTFLNIMHKLFDFTPIKVPVLMTFLITLYMNL